VKVEKFHAEGGTAVTDTRPSSDVPEMERLTVRRTSSGIEASATALMEDPLKDTSELLRSSPSM